MRHGAAGQGAMVAVKDGGPGEDEWQLWRSIRCRSTGRGSKGSSWIPQMKNVPLQQRAPLLSAAIQAGTDAVQGRRVLLVDDLWETASTLRRVAEVLEQMGATEVRALVMTRTK